MRHGRSRSNVTLCRQFPPGFTIYTPTRVNYRPPSARLKHTATSSKNGLRIGRLYRNPIYLAVQYTVPVVPSANTYHHSWRNWGGGTGRDLPLRAPLIPFPGWDPGVPIYNENGPFLLLLDCFSAIAIVVQVVLGLLRHLRTLFHGGPKA